MNETNNSITCPNCGATNSIGTNFCVNCGTQLQNNNVAQNVSTNTNTQNQVAGSTSATTQMNFIGYMVGALLKPFDKFKSEEENLSSIKNSAIISAIVIVGATIINLFTTMFNAVRVESFWSNEVEWVWENLKEVEYLKVIGMNLLMYAGVIFGLAAIYYVGSLIIKKEAKYPKLLGATATAYMPIIISTAILSPILSLIHFSFGLIVTVVGAIYGIIILLELIDHCIVIENKNVKIYFHTACLSIAILVIGFILYKVVLGSITSSITGGLGSLDSIFG